MIKINRSSARFFKIVRTLCSDAPANQIETSEIAAKLKKLRVDQMFKDRFTEMDKKILELKKNPPPKFRIGEIVEKALDDEAINRKHSVY